MHSHVHTAGSRLRLVLVLNLAITLVELLGGILSGSLALLSDAAHNLGDALSAATSYIALKIAGKPPTKKYSFGYRRAETLAAFFNSNLLLFTTALIAAESLTKLIHPEPVEAEAAAYTAGFALAANTLAVLLLHSHSSHSLNVKSVYLHMLGDVMASLAVLAAIVALKYTGLYVLDPLTSLAISLYIAREAASLARKAAEVLMNASPIDLEAVKEELEAIPGVADVHHCHAWMISEHEVAVECHVEVEGNPSLEEAQDIIREARERLARLGIGHVTLQLEKNLCSEKGLVCGNSAAEKQEQHYAVAPGTGF